MVLTRDRWRCVSCKADVSRPGQARVDHIKPLKTHPDLACDMANLRTLCPSCDNQGHREKGQRKGSPRNERFSIRGVDRNGMPIDPKHHWLTKVNDDGGEGQKTTNPATNK